MLKFKLIKAAPVGDTGSFGLFMLDSNDPVKNPPNKNEMCDYVEITEQTDNQGENISDLRYLPGCMRSFVLDTEGFEKFMKDQKINSVRKLAIAYEKAFAKFVTLDC